MLYCLYFQEINDILLPKENLKKGEIVPKNILNLVIFQKFLLSKGICLEELFQYQACFWNLYQKVYLHILEISRTSAM